MAKKKKKPKVKPVVQADEDDDLEPVATKKKGRRSDEDDSKPRARYDVYFGLTLITTLVLIGAAALLYVDQEDLKLPANTGFNPPTVNAGPLGFRPPAVK